MTSQQQSAFNLARDTNSSFFLTGKAGTGKTTFLRRIQKEIDKNFVVLAPTGVAAVVAGGETIHSFFGMPPTEVITPHTNFKIGLRKIEVLRHVDTIIIDEVSMVRCDLIDGIDYVLRKVLKSSLPFAGKQIILSGDLFQLEPIISRGVSQEMLQDLYGSIDKPFFYRAHVFKRFNLPRIEFQTIFRQDDATFKRVLNNIREYHATDEDLRVLNTHVYSTMPDDGLSIILSPYKVSVDSINSQHLDKLTGEKHSYEAITEGEFTASHRPADELLVLKEGAQVMFTRNDSNRRWVNGTLATVTQLTDDNIRVRLDNGLEVDVEQAQWEQYSYVYNRETHKLESELKGMYTQYPLRLAWAITIHKSQGLTFDRMVLDLKRGVFASGQLYVALSRVKSLDGLMLNAPVQQSHIHRNAEISAFAHTFNDQAVIDDELEDGRAIDHHLRAHDYDSAAKACLQRAVAKTRQGRLRDAALMVKKLLDITICDDCLLTATAEVEPLHGDGVTANFLNAVFCLYGDQPELALAYAERVIAAKSTCKEAWYVKSRALSLLDRWKEADAANCSIMELEGLDYDKDHKLLFHIIRVSQHLGEPADDHLTYLHKLFPKYAPVSALFPQDE